MELSNNHNLYIKDGVKTGTSAETPSTCVWCPAGGNFSDCSKKSDR